MTQTYQPFDACLICGGEVVSVLATIAEMERQARERDNICRALFHPDAPDYILKDHVFFTHTYPARLVSCNTCGLVYRDPRLSESAALHEYKADVYHPEWLEASFQAYRTAFRARMPSLTQLLGRPRVLEVGSHVGGFLASAGECGWDAVGVDVGECVSEFARGKSLNAITGTIEEAAFDSGSFDAVFVWVCFDQLPDPWGTLSEISRVLKDRGFLFLKVPNGDFIKVANRLRRSRFSSVRNHVSRLMAYSILLGFPFQIGYTPPTLRDLLGRRGFSDVRVSNQTYIPVTNDRYTREFALRTEMRYIKAAQFFSELVRYASIGQFLKAPWIEVSCRKASQP